LERGTLADIGNVPLERQSEDENARLAKRQAKSAVKSPFEPADHMAGHGMVDLAGKLDETGRQPELTRFPGEVKRIDWNTMPTKSRPWIEGHEAEGLGLGGLDDLPDIDSHRVEYHLELIDERDVDRTKYILGDLGGLGCIGRGNLDDLGDKRTIESGDKFCRFGSLAGDDLGDVDGVKDGITGILALWRIAEKEIAPRL